MTRTRKSTKSKAPRVPARVYTPEELAMDLITVFEKKDLADMSDEELEKRIIKLQQMRTIKITQSKKLTPFDVLINSIDIQKARSYLAVLEPDWKG